MNIHNIEIPPHSPDINIIENVWASLKRYVRRKSCSTIEEIQKRISHFFNNILVCRKYISHFKSVLHCMKKIGGLV